MAGWMLPLPVEPAKSRAEFDQERTVKAEWLTQHGILRSERIKEAILKVRREDFIPRYYRDYAYLEVPLPLPGEQATVSCPHSYPLFYEALGLDVGHRFLEVGTGSGYGAALAQEIGGPGGLVVSIEIDPDTFAFAKRNLARAGYRDIILIRGDGGLGYSELSPYDWIAVTAACTNIPPPLFGQLCLGGRLVAPVVEQEKQALVLFEKSEKGIQSRIVTEVLYVRLRGIYGTE
jgi:protein-L-isoaspartate(D-aspartate) O-methyltransferase